MKSNGYRLYSPLIRIFSGLVILFTSSLALAVDPENPPGTVEQTFLEGNIAVSQWLDGVAEGLDMFLVGQKLTRKRNETFVRLENQTFIRERETLQNQMSINASLRLPNVEEYWQLKFTSYDETRERRISQAGNLRRTPRDRDLGASLGLFQKLGNVRASFQPRVALQERFKISHSLTFESLAELETYRVNPKLQLFGDANSGAGIYTAMNLDYRLTRVWGMTLINDFEYRDRVHEFVVTNGFSIGRSVSRKSSFSYDVIFDSNNREAYHLESYNVGVTWSQLLYSKILDYAVSPGYSFSRENNFNGVPGVTITFNLTF